MTPRFRPLSSLTPNPRLPESSNEMIHPKVAAKLLLQFIREQTLSAPNGRYMVCKCVCVCVQPKPQSSDYSLSAMGTTVHLSLVKSME